MKNKSPSEVFRKNLKSARNLRKLSQKELAERAGLPISSVAHFEIGSRKPSFDTLRKLASTLEITTDYLLGRTDNPSLAQASDPLYRNIGQLTQRDRELAEEFLKVLADRNKDKKKGSDS